MDAYWTLLVCVNAYFLAVVLSNIVYLRRATRSPSVADGPRVSVIVPARNEQQGIARCVESLLTQRYTDFEVIVVDDESTDATHRILTRLAERHPRLRVVSGEPLPDGWLGKQHALAQGVSLASGEILMFTDADTVHTPDSISWAVTNLQSHDADLVSGYLAQQYTSFGERLTVPAMFVMMMVMPFGLVPRTRDARIAFAIGQLIAVRRDSFADIGGFRAISDSIVDDLSLAKRMKRCGKRIVFLDARRVAGCHMYDSFRPAFDGLARTVYSAVGGHPLAVLGIVALVGAAIVWPAWAALASALRLEAPTMPLALAVILFSAQWALLAWDRDVPVSAVALYPLLFLGLALVAFMSMLDTGFGRGVVWKDRLVHVPRHPTPPDDVPAEGYPHP